MRAVREHRGERLTGIQPSLVRLRDVGHEIGLHAARLPEDLGQAAEESVVGDLAEGPQAREDHLAVPPPGAGRAC